MQRVRAKGNDGIQITKHRKAKDRVDGDIGTESERDSNRSSKRVDVRGAVSDHSSEIAVGRRIEIGGLADSTTELDRFEWVLVVKRNEFGNQIGPLRQSAAGVHEANKRRIDRSIGAKIEINMRKTVANSNRHGWRHDTRFRSMGREGLGKHQHKLCLFKNRRRESNGRRRRRVHRRRKGLSSRDARWRRSGQVVTRKRITFAKVGFMSE